ncbi:hypothetical protein [Streptomyces spiramyceticus]|uniref:hypothetical protein n=1 Tax=Streptomyces spiramyceticus TaxID=299717 RepID=UPI00237A0A6C|nr:hypothetical protein [Streptomyces spiramyceticus]
MSPHTAFGLGPRPNHTHDRSDLWFPWSCTSHRGDAEYAELLDHCTHCLTCLEDDCETGAQLRRAVRKAR